MEFTAQSFLSEDELIMARGGNRKWWKQEPIGPVVPTITSFEQAVKELRLQPDQYLCSTRLREWARRNKNSKFIPESLLQSWGFETAQNLPNRILILARHFRRTAMKPPRDLIDE
jgi:hypothetical protein